MTGLVRSVNVGDAEPNPARRGGGSTGHGKRPVDSAWVGVPTADGSGSGLAGDFIGNRRHHGGRRKAVYAFAREELDWWEGRLGQALPDGHFAENLTTQGLDVDASRVGDRWAVGDDLVLEVCGPRTPCRTFAHRMGVRGWMRMFGDRARPGAYLSVLAEGPVRTDDPVRVVHRAEHEVDLSTTLRAYLGDLDAVRIVLDAGFLPEDEVAWLRGRLAARE